MNEPLRPPTRLRDDPSLSGAMRSGLDELHQSDVSFDVDAGEKRLLAAIAIGAGVATAATATATAASATASSTVTSAAATVSASGASVGGVSTIATATGVSLATKVMLGLAITSASAIGVYSARERWAGGDSVDGLGDRTPSPVTAPSSVATQSVEAPRPRPLEPTPIERTPQSNAERAADPAEQAATAAPVERVPEPVRHEPSAPAARPSVEEETRHLAELRGVEASDPARAVRMADEGHARFARGVFWQEREAIAIFALRRLGRTADAERRAAAFIERHPKSPFVEALRAH